MKKNCPKFRVKSEKKKRFRPKYQSFFCIGEPCPAGAFRFLCTKKLFCSNTSLSFPEKF